MAKYKRHSQGGRFRTANFGDLGLRAYKDQQNQQIQSLKEQNQQYDSITKGHLQEMRGAASREIEHNRQLQNFYNKRDNLAIENTKFRGETEYKRLMGEAKEYEKKADFWKNFSTTYAAQYAKAAGSIMDVATTHQSNNELDIIYNDPKFKKFEANVSKLNNLSSKAQLDEAVNILRDKKASLEEKNDYLGHIVDLGFRMNHKTKLALIQRELNNWPQEHNNLRALAGNPGKYPEGHPKAGQDKPPIPWNAETIGQFYYLRGREILRAYDIDPSSKAGRALLEGIDAKATEERNRLSGVSKANADGLRREDLSNETKNLITVNKIAVKNGTVVASGTNAIEYNLSFNTRVIFEGNSYKLSENGQVVKPTGGNIHHDMVNVMKADIASGRFVTKEQAKRHTILQLIPGAKVTYEDDGRTMVYSEKDTYLGKHPSVLEEFEEAWADYEKDQHTEFKEKKLLKDFHSTQEIQRRAMLPEDDENFLNLSDRKVVAQLMKENSGNEKTIEFLGNFQIYNAYNLNENMVTADLTQKFKDGKLNELEAHLTYLPPAVQDQWRSKLEQLKILERKGYIGAKLTSKAQGILRDILGKESKKPGALSGDHFSTVTEYIKQDILATFDEISEDNPDASDSKKISLMREEIQRKIDAQEGIYRRGNSGLSTVFYADPTIKEPGSEDVITESELQKKLALDGNTYTATSVQNLLDGLTSDPKNPGTIEVKIDENTVVRKSLIPINEADEAVRNINLGIKLPQNDTIDYLYNNQPLKDGDRQYSKRDFWNAYFESIGLGSIVKANEIDFSKYKVKKSSTTANLFRLSEEDQAKVGLYCELADEADFIDKSKPSVEATRTNKNKQVQQNVLQRMWAWIPQDTKEYLVGS